MDTIKSGFLENPVWVYTALVALELVLFSMWFSTRSTKLKWGLLLPILLGAMVFTLDWIVVTDREEIESILSKITTSFHNGNVEEQGHFIADNYHGYLNTKVELVKAAVGEAGKGRVESIAVKFQSVKVTGAWAEMKIKTNVRLDTGQIIPLLWTIYWGKSDSEWKIIEISAPNIGL